MKKAHLFALVVCWFSLVKLSAQDNVIPSGHLLMNYVDRYELLSGDWLKGTQSGSGYVFRTQLLDLIERNQLNNLSEIDSFNLFGYVALDLQFGYQNSPFQKRGIPFKPKPIFSSPAYFIDYKNAQNSYRFTLNPVLGLHLGRNFEEQNRLLYNNSRGIEVKGFVGKKNRVGVYSLVTENQVAMPSYMDYFTDSIGYLPHQGFWKPFKENGYDFFHARGHLWFNVNEHIQFRFGHDKVHWGNGMRSLVLSDNAPANLFFQINTNIGRLHYQNYFAEYTDSTQIIGRDHMLPKKFGAFHKLGINITKKLNISVFEAIVFDRQDVGQSGSFDLQYLNPIIFYRAIEQNLGSQDNAIVGLDWKWNMFRRFQWYGQFVLDEFKLSELRANNGWWANKHAFQTGLKYMNVLGLKNADLFLEYNTVRPFTYSHYRSGGNWAHFGQSLAHPLGANFREYLARIHYQPTRRLFVNLAAMLAIKGEDDGLNGPNNGGNILRISTQRAREYGNKTTQGERTQIFMFDARVSYMLYHNLFLDLNSNYRVVNSTQYHYPQTALVNIGMRWNFDAQDRLRLF